MILQLIKKVYLRLQNLVENRNLSFIYKTLKYDKVEYIPFAKMKIRNLFFPRHG